MLKNRNKVVPSGLFENPEIKNPGILCRTTFYSTWYSFSVFLVQYSFFMFFIHSLHAILLVHKFHSYYVNGIMRSAQLLIINADELINIVTIFIIGNSFALSLSTSLYCLHLIVLRCFVNPRFGSTFVSFLVTFYLAFFFNKIYSVCNASAFLSFSICFNFS